jgi:hypothetical protein
MKIDFDSFDLIVCVALAGGFMTGEWMPFVILVALVTLSAV